MRFESSVTSVSWIPSEAVRGLFRAPFDLGAMRYDDPPPDELEDLDGMEAGGRFRFANTLHAWVEVEDDRVVRAGHAGRGYISATHVSIGSSAAVVFQPTAFPSLQEGPDISPTKASFRQTTGGRTGLPAPRRVRRKPYLQLSAPTVWTTLALTIRADGSSEHEVIGASGFPRHWIYDHDHRLVAKVGRAEFRDWYRTAFGKHTPWGAEDSRPFVTIAESALERQLSTSLMRGGAKPRIRRLQQGDVLVEQGDVGHDLFLVLDGIFSVVVDDEKLGEVGPGAILGERALLEGGHRTATLRAVTDATAAVAPSERIDKSALVELARGHRREDDR